MIKEAEKKGIVGRGATNRMVFEKESPDDKKNGKKENNVDEDGWTTVTKK